MDYFVKKTWIRIAVCAVLVAAAVLAMTGVFGGSKPIVYDPSGVNGADAASTEATEQGFGGDVTVYATLDGSKVLKLAVETPNETEGLGKRASDAEFTEQFIGKSGPFTFGEDGIEALSGATVTSNAALKAINRAITGEEPAEAEPEKPEEPAAVPEETHAGETKEEPAETAGEAAEATEQGFGGDVTVHLILDGDQVQTLTVDTPNETAGLGQRASEEAFTGQFIGKRAPFAYGENGIEALTGATVTSNAVLKAINRAAGAEEATAVEPETAEKPAGETEKPAAEETGTEASAGQAYGVYRASAKNDFSTVTVTASAKNGQLANVKITSEGAEGMDLLTDEIKEEWAKAILESGSASPDAVTGATLKFSAASVQEAMTEILAEMNAETSPEEAEEKPAEEKAEEPAAQPETEQKDEKAETASAGQTYGAYRASAKNDFSTVTVTASAKNGQLANVKITSEGAEGMDLLTDEIKEEWAKAILESGSASPDAVTGATLKFSAASVQEAMTEILAEMNGETAPEQAEEKPAEDKADEPAAQPETEQKDEKAESASAGPVYGAYRASAKNDFSTVTVIASAKNGQLTNVKITSEGAEGMDLLTDEIKAEWAKAILESGSASPDAVTGATLKFSAASVQEAMTAILAKMNGETAPEQAEGKPAEEKAEEPAAQPETEQKDEKAETASAGPVYGAYRASAKNDFSTVTVIASAKNGQLTKVKITSEGAEGMDLLTDEIKAEWAKAILESGSASPDAVTCATLKFSAASVQEAMTEILAKMNGKTAEAPAEEKEEPAKETEKQTEGGNDLLSLIAVSMGREKENSYITDYLEQDPYLVNIYQGYGFAKEYGSARGHAFTLEDVQKTARPHPKANCLTCKTPDMHKMILEQGVGVYSMPFDEVMAQTANTISCYTCHGADDGNGGKMVVTHQYVNEALGANTGEIKAASLSCGQCHIEYYFTPSDSEAMMPYHSVSEMTPEAILAYYEDLGFSDWEQPGTGTGMLKAQHPELETYLSGKHASLLSCADCHMPVVTTDNGVQYHDHHLFSPLTSETLLAKCAACHGSAENTIALVQGIQTKVTARETEVGNKLSALKDELTAAVADAKMSEDELNAVRKLHREAQWFFDFCYVENSEGAHNSELAYRCLDTSESKIDEAMGLLAAAGIPDNSAGAP